ncbi:hypothetical protein SRHO_G00078000 [Serrasalmus rhombeus]
MCHHVAVRELPPVTPADAVHILESDFKDIDDASRRVSQEDILFLNKLKESIRKNAQGHYEVPLPFKERPILPCNKHLALIRLNHLKRKLLRDETYKKHYDMSMNEVIEREDAEEIRNDGVEGEKWYIPHHGVYHPKKPDKLHVVFDCSARYEGFVAPVLLIGKRILQEMCRHGTGWDDPLKVELRPRWERWRSDLYNLDRIDIPRSYAPASFRKIVRTELHHFSDASISGYGQCSYLRLSNEEGDVHSALVIGKSRVAPTKLTTIPRLELTAAVVSVKVSNVLKEELVYAYIQEFFWTDSKVVLGYIKNEARRFHTFIANRVQRIHLSTTPQQWKYIPITENPTDRASRGLTVSELLSSNWFTGPRFLWEKDMHFPSDVIPELPIGDPEIKVIHTLNMEAAEHLSLIDCLSNFSSWPRAIQAVACILRQINKDKSTA